MFIIYWIGAALLTFGALSSLAKSVKSPTADPATAVLAAILNAAFIFLMVYAALHI
jgi:uncharacterized protein with PQ loop repeat